MVGRYCNYQRILTDCNSQFPLYIFLRLAAKCQKPVLALKIMIKIYTFSSQIFYAKNSYCLLFLACHYTAFLDACNDRAWLTSECSPRSDNFGTVRQATA